jgi:hypothetical protein
VYMFNLHTVRNLLRGIDQLDVGDVTIWYQSIFWSSMARSGWSGMLQHGIRAPIFNTELGWAEQVELK